MQGDGACNDGTLSLGAGRTRRVLRALRASGMLATDATRDATDATGATTPTKNLFMEPYAVAPVKKDISSDPTSMDVSS